MGWLNKKEKGSDGHSSMANAQLKENLADAAMSMLVKGEHYENYEGITVEFGYLYYIEGHGLEALYKATTDKGVYYFAAQKSSVMRLNFNEELYQSTIDGFLQAHQN